MDANEQRARELRDRYCPAGNYEHSDVLDAIMAALDMKPALSKPKVQTEHLWCTNCEGVHPESCFNATPSAQQVPADGEWVPETELLALVAGPYMYHHKMDEAAMREARAFDRCRELTIQNIQTWCAMRRAMLAATPQAPQPVVDVTIGQQAVDVEVLRAFERKFWQAVSMTDSRGFDHDVCKEVRDFREVIAALAAHGKGG